MPGVSSASADDSTKEVEVYFDDTQISIEEIVSGLLESAQYSDTQNYYWTKRVNITAEQAKNLIDSKPGTVVVDVREEDEYCGGHISGSAMFPWNSGVFQTEYNTILPSSGGVLLACRSGNRSVEASDFLGSSSGGNYTKNHMSSVVVYNMVGGMNDWTYDTDTCSSNYNITSPAPGSTLSSTSATFSWDSGAEKYWLWIGTSAESHDLYSANQGTNTSRTVSDLPFSGETLYVRLWSVENGEWLYNDYTYTACSIVAGMLSPTSGSTLDSTTQTFTWNNSGASQYWLWIGTSAGKHDLYSDGQGTNTSATISDLPNNGITLYVRLWSVDNAEWFYNDYTFTAFVSISSMQSPVSGSTLDSTTQTFTWDNSGASQYWLWVGTSAEGHDIYSGDQGTGTSGTVSDLPSSGETLYVR
ncbi:MAG: rhodanese-like domain-containing protein, partial [Lentisphaerae bacterium]|nr:rhodanese-like domain-containing protein [Lentisphaerota bacterium]